jgi:hypothetical protein
MFASLFAAALLAPLAQDRAVDAQAATGQPPQRVRSVTIQRGERCPPSTSDEVVVCAVLGEPYRIPSQLRETAPSAANQSWVNRASTVDQVSRRAGGLPDTCSPVGTGGQSGCALQLNNAYAAQRREEAREGESVP